MDGQRYTLTFAVLLLTGAALGDRFGRRRVFAVGIGIFTLGSIAAALAPSVEALNLARAFQGLGGAIVMPLTLTILSAAVPAEKRGLALGAWGGIAGLAVAFGPLVGGAITQGIAWQWIFWLNVPIGVLLIPLALSRLKESYGPEGRLDLPGLGLVSAGLFGIVWGLVRGNSVGWASPQIVTALLVGLVLVAAFVAWELRTDAPMLPMRFPQRHVRAREHRFAVHVLRHVRLDLPAGAVLPDGAGLLAARLRPALPALDARADVHRAARRSALGQDPGEEHDRRRPRDAGGRARLDGVGRDAHDALLAADRPLHRRRRRHGALLRAGGEPRPSAVRPEEEGKSSGANNAIRELGGVFGVAVLASIFAHVGGYGTGQSFVDGMNPALFVGAGVVALGALAAFMIPRQPRVAESSGRAGARLRGRSRLIGPRYEPDRPRRRSAFPGSGSPLIARSSRSS